MVARKCQNDFGLWQLMVMKDFPDFYRLLFSITNIVNIVSIGPEQ